MGRAPNKGSPEVKSAILIGLFPTFSDGWKRQEHHHSPWSGAPRPRSTSLSFPNDALTRIHSKNVCVNTILGAALIRSTTHLVPAPLVGSVQTGAGLQAWSEEAVKAAPRIVKPRGRFRSRPITCAGALA